MEEFVEDAILKKLRKNMVKRASKVRVPKVKKSIKISLNPKIQFVNPSTEEELEEIITFVYQIKQQLNNNNIKNRLYLRTFWETICCQKLSVDFIRKHQDNVDWEHLSRNHNLADEKIIREFQDKVNWCYISQCQKLSENFIREFQDKVYWGNISFYQNLSENFIREFQDKVDWASISRFQNLSIDFILEFLDKVNWNNISRHQNLSEDFIRKFKDKIDWNNLRINKKIQVSDEFTIEFDKELSGGGISMINNKYHRILGSVFDEKFAYNYGQQFWYRGQQINVKTYKEYVQWLKVKDF